VLKIERLILDEDDNGAVECPGPFQPNGIHLTTRRAQYAVQSRSKSIWLARTIGPYSKIVEFEDSIRGGTILIYALDSNHVSDLTNNEPECFSDRGDFLPNP